MIGGVAVREAPDSMFMNINATGSNASDAINVELRDKSRVQVAVMVTTHPGQPPACRAAVANLTVYPKQQQQQHV